MTVIHLKNSKTDDIWRVTLGLVRRTCHKKQDINKCMEFLHVNYSWNKVSFGRSLTMISSLFLLLYCQHDANEGYLCLSKIHSLAYEIQRFMSFETSNYFKGKYWSTILSVLRSYPTVVMELCNSKVSL